MKQLLENALNRYLALDPESISRIALLRDKIVTIELLGLPLSMQMHFLTNKIQLHWDAFLPPDLIIKGTPLNLLHMSLAPEQRRRFFAEDIVVSGNMELAQQVLNIFDDLEIDWEEALSQWMGDVPAHKTSFLLRELKTWGQHVRQALRQNTDEYVHEEIRLVPPTEELQQFLANVDELCMDVDRLQARVERVQQLIIARNSS